jgi:hypothetical protein
LQSKSAMAGLFTGSHCRLAQTPWQGLRPPGSQATWCIRLSAVIVAQIRSHTIATRHVEQHKVPRWSKLDAQRRSAFRFVQVSTDEVYGSLGVKGHFVESTPYAPNPPYSASKAVGGARLISVALERRPFSSTRCN